MDHAEAHRRNAMLRAWQAYGVPVKGGWVLNGEFGWWFSIECGDLNCLGFGLTTPRDVAGDLDETERRAVLAASSWGVGQARCTHLLPLLSSPPRKVLAIYELELLGGAP